MKKIILLVLICVVIITIIGYKNDNLNLNFLSASKVITAEEAKAKAVKFIDENLVQPGTQVDIKSVTEEGGLYRIDITVGKQDIVSYMTKDGKKFFPEAMDIADTQKKAADAQKADDEAEKNIPKADKPAVDLYVMSFCPFGNQAEDTLAPVYALLKDKVDFNFHYIVSLKGDTVESLHGPKEVDQNMREACVLKEYGKNSWMDFVSYVNKNCGSDGACWEAGAKASNINTDKVNACVKANGLSLMKENEKASNDVNASGSPTMIINGATTKAVYKYGNPEAYKQAICNGFNNAPEECAKVLDSAAATSQGGSCGN
jgi:hypothetical protein